ncbi:MAG: hypothetical protein WAU01_16485, partial [Saprospiraceae bacterium]
NPPHGDNHDMWINPNDPNLFIQCNDGGANVTHNGGKTWSTQFNQPTAELYQVEVDDQYPYWLYAGQQDNYTTIAVPSMIPNSIQTPGVGWIINTGGCETGPAVPKPGNHNIVYVNCKGSFGVFNKITGVEKGYQVGASNIYGHNPKDLKYRFQRVAPIHVSPHNPNVVYHGSQYLHKTINDGETWETISPDLTAFEADKQVISGSPITRDITGEEIYSTLYAIQESVLKEGLIWTGSNDGLIYVTKDGGKSWDNVTPAKLPKGGRVNGVEASSHDPNKAYISVLRYQLGDNQPYIYKTTNSGKTWDLLTTGDNGIAKNIPTRVIREDPVRPGLLYAGTEVGVFISFDDGKNWKKFQQNLPLTPVTDIKIHRGDLVLSTMGRSFWILDKINALRQPAFESVSDKPVLFKPDNTIRYRLPRVSNDQTTFPVLPQSGVIFDYFLPKDFKSGIRMDILDVNKQVVATFISDSTKQKLPDETIRDMSTNRVIYIVDKSLSTKDGLNRFKWDMKHVGPYLKESRRRYQNGPLAAPGQYSVRLTVGKTVLEESFELMMDPKVKTSGISEKDISDQITMQKRIIALISEAQKYQESLEQEVKKLKGDATKADRLKKVEAALKSMKTEDGAYPQPMLNDQIMYLYGMIGDADQIPGKEAEMRYTELNEQFMGIKKGLE